MALYQLKTYSDLIAAIREELQIQSSDMNAINRIKRDINIVYSEIVAEQRWWWLNATTSVQLGAFYSNGTASVATDSATVTLSIAPNDSKKGCLFAIDGYNEIFRVVAHTAGSPVLVLDGGWTGTTQPTGAFKIWKAAVPLPTDCKETISVWHDHSNNSLQSVGIQEFRRIAKLGSRSEGKPSVYATSDFVDPSQASIISGLPAVSSRSSSGVVKTLVFSSSLPAALVASINANEPNRWRVSNAGNYTYNGDIIVSTISTTALPNDTITYTGKFESQEGGTLDNAVIVSALGQESDYDRYRELWVHPSLTQSRITLHVDYIREVLPLQNDLDEPVMPLEDRVVLLYGALHRAWAKIGRNAEEATRNLTLYNNKLAKMQGKLQDTFDKPKLSPSRGYLGSKRNINRFRTTSQGSVADVGGGSSGAVVTGTPNTVATFGSDGNVVGSASVSTTELGYLDGVTGPIQTQLDTLNALSNGKIYVGNASNQATAVTPTGDVTVSNSGTTTIAPSAITNAKVSASAAIARSKLASGTASVLLANDGSGVMSETTIFASEVAFLSGSQALASVTLTDNTASATVAFTVPVANTVCSVLYSLKRGSAIESGIINLINDGSNAGIAQGGIASLGTLGVVFSADVSGGNVRLKYTTTNTGTAATLKYKLHKWQA